MVEGESIWQTPLHVLQERTREKAELLQVGLHPIDEPVLREGDDHKHQQVFYPIPNFRGADEEKKQALTESVESQLRFRGLLERKEDFRDISQVNEALVSIEDVILAEARVILKETASPKPLLSKTLLLKKEKKRLRYMKDTLTKSSRIDGIPESRRESIELKLRRQVTKYVEMKCLDISIMEEEDLSKILNKLIYRLKKAIKSGDVTVDQSVHKITRGKEGVGANRSKNFDFNPQATIHKMLNGDTSAKILVMRDPTSGEITAEPEKIKEILLCHYREVFEEKEAAEVDQKEEVHRILKDTGRHIDESQYDRLMEDVSLRELIHNSESIASMVLLLFNACLRFQDIPEVGKLSIIAPIKKKPNEVASLKNLRPIALQNGLVKILNLILARRLTRIFHKHRTLHQAQEGFVKAGSTQKCIDVILDVWED